MRKPYRLRRLRLGQGLTATYFFTCARPGYELDKSVSPIRNDVVDKWVQRLVSTALTCHCNPVRENRTASGRRGGRDRYDRLRVNGKLGHSSSFIRSRRTTYLALLFALVLVLGGCASPPPVTGMRLATLNAQFRVAPATTSECCRFMGSGRIDRLAARILASNYDVVVFQEAFDDEAQDGLADLLRSEYPHIVKYIDGHGTRIDVDEDEIDEILAGRLVIGGTFTFCTSPLLGADGCQDSGLMLFSRYPFELLSVPSARWDPDEIIAESAGVDFKDVAFREFGVCEGSIADCVANKGIALVRIRHPSGEIYNIAWTHLQAGEARIKQKVRIAQLRAVESLINMSLTEDEKRNEHIVLLGDLNIDGNQLREPDRSEWDFHFGRSAGGSSGFFHDFIRDQWLEEMEAIPMVDIVRRDLGLTATSIVQEKRIDYVIMNSPNAAGLNEPMCVQHIFRAFDLFSGTPMRETASGRQAGLQPLSDHIGVGIDLNLPTPACSPRQANVLQDVEFDNPASTAVREGSDVRLTHQGSVQWFRIDRPGTYSINLVPRGGAALSFQVYSSSEMSLPLAPYGFDDDPSVMQFGIRYHLPEAPFFIKVLSPSDAIAEYRLEVHRHRCTTPQDACVLYPNRETGETFTFPGGAAGGRDELWFELHTDASFSGRPQTIEYVVTEPPGTSPSTGHELTLFNGETMTILATIPAGFPAHIMRTGGDERAHRRLRVRRSVPGVASTVSVAWNTDLRVIDLVGLQVLEETDDVFGGDEDDDLRVNLFLEDGYVLPRGGEIRMGDFLEDDYKPVSEYLRCPIGYVTAGEPPIRPAIVIEEVDPDANDWLLGSYSSFAPVSPLELLEYEDSGRPPSPHGPTTPSGNGFARVENDSRYRIIFGILPGTQTLTRNAARLINGWLYCDLKQHFRDRDGDGIDDDVDLDPAPSDAFSDIFGGLRGGTFGTITDRGDRDWFVRDEPNDAATTPVDGVRITVGPGLSEGVVEGMTWSGGCAPMPRIVFPPVATDTEVVYSCGSVNIQTIQGEVRVSLGGRVVTIGVGESVNFE